ncbi:MAG: type II toxin-antitoxin system RelB/DinJ family antitoxin [Candidatus Enterosoma sp.]|nr:type II toxin-antitoxin system RelB/DinJ family antitoxin [Candidatus Enterosoma sp.]
MANAKFNIRLDSDLKKRAESMYAELGIDLNTAIIVFLQKSLEVRGFPFEVRLEEPNKETLLALLDADKIFKDNNTKGMDIEKALIELKK